MTKSINSLKISQADTTKLWNEIEKLKNKLGNTTLQESFSRKRSRLNASLDAKTNDTSLGNDGGKEQNNNLVKISKFQIKYSFEMKN